MDYYQQALEAIVVILKSENHEHWVNWMKKDIEFWKNEKSTNHHTGAYGGMGSFRDSV